MWFANRCIVFIYILQFSELCSYLKTYIYVYLPFCSVVLSGFEAATYSNSDFSSHFTSGQLNLASIMGLIFVFDLCLIKHNNQKQLFLNDTAQLISLNNTVPFIVHQASVSSSVAEVLQQLMMSGHLGNGIEVNLLLISHFRSINIMKAGHVHFKYRWENVRVFYAFIINTYKSHRSCVNNMYSSHMNVEG